MEWFKRYRENERPERFDRIVQSWTPPTRRPTQRFQRVHDLGIKGKNPYLLSVFRRRLEYPALKRAVRDQQNLFGANVVLAQRLKQNQDATAQVTATTASAPVAVLEVRTGTEFYFEEGELLVPPTFDSTPEEKAAGF